MDRTHKHNSNNIFRWAGSRPWLASSGLLILVQLRTNRELPALPKLTKPEMQNLKKVARSLETTTCMPLLETKGRHCYNVIKSSTEIFSSEVYCMIILVFHSRNHFTNIIQLKIVTFSALLNYHFIIWFHNR